MPLTIADLFSMPTLVHAIHSSDTDPHLLVSWDALEVPHNEMLWREAQEIFYQLRSPTGVSTLPISSLWERTLYRELVYLVGDAWFAAFKQDVTDAWLIPETRGLPVIPHLRVPLRDSPESPTWLGLSGGTFTAVCISYGGIPWRSEALERGRGYIQWSVTWMVLAKLKGEPCPLPYPHYPRSTA